MFSVFDIFQICVGPSGPQTSAPMKAACHFVKSLAASPLLSETDNINVDFYGQFSLTGKMNFCDVGIILGLLGYTPEVTDLYRTKEMIATVSQSRTVRLDGKKEIFFCPQKNISYNSHYLPQHENGLILRAYSKGKLIYHQTYYATGGTEITTDISTKHENEHVFPYKFRTAEELLFHCENSGLSVPGVMMINESSRSAPEKITERLFSFWQIMLASINRGVNTEGVLPGVMKVPRRASSLYKILTNRISDSSPLGAMDWVNMFAMAVTEENASGGLIITAPTNCSCGVFPAVLAYYDKFIHKVSPEICTRYFLTGAATGALFKMNASISGAEIGCQGEIGVACAMAASALVELQGGSPEKICNAAEIAIEHHLGLTCDSFSGQSQVPCIERNAVAAITAINAAGLSMCRTSRQKISLDKIIKTMYATGKGMSATHRNILQGNLNTAIQDEIN